MTTHHRKDHPVEEQGTHFWFMTIQWRNPNGTTGVGSYQGTRSPARKETRLDAFNSIRATLAKRDPRTADGLTLAFDIQPNKL